MAMDVYNMGCSVAMVVLIRHIVLLCASMALYGMLVWRWQPYKGCWCGGGCLIWVAGVAVAALLWHIGLSCAPASCPIYDAGVAVAASYWMLVCRWLP